jgi:integrase
MPNQKLTDADAKKLEAPAKGNRVYYDSTGNGRGAPVEGFGLRITGSGARSFILNYRRRSDGTERRFTIGGFPNWSVGAAREEARRLKRLVDGGADPVGELREQREAPTVNELADRFEEEHLAKKRISTQADYRSMLRVHIRPALGRRKVASLEFADVDALHRAITKHTGPYRANRVVAVLSKMLTLAVKWKYRADNPCRGVERNYEQARKRYCSGDELANLSKALAEHDDRDAADIFRTLLLTGARKSEVLAMRWRDVDFDRGTWTKEGATTKTHIDHVVPLNGPARQLIAARPRTGDYVFPGRHAGHRIEIKANWRRILKSAGIKQLRIHDLRHSFASQLASAGIGLHVIGALLGHVEPRTTQRYAHLLDHVEREATERVGAIIAGKPAAEVVPLKRGRS